MPVLSGFGEAALVYGGRGDRVLPVHTIRNGACSCGKANCQSPGKHPIARLVPHGVHDATADVDTIRGWWTEFSDANVGIALGNGRIVLDIDPRNGGLENLELLHLESIETLTTMTGGNGLHLWFEAGADVSRLKLPPGIDLKRDGGYVVAPPSIHYLGGTYRWLNFDQEIAKLPHHVLGSGSNGATPSGTANGTAAGHTIEPDLKLWVADLYRTCPQGGRNTTLTRLAGYFRNLHPEPVSAAILLDWNRKYCDPPLPEDEVLENVHHKYRRYAGVIPITSTVWTARSLLQAALPEPEMIISEMMSVGLTFFGGRPKNYKSFLALQISKDVATGEQSLGKAVRTGKVIYFALEDSPLRLKNRLKRQGTPETDLIQFYTDYPKLDEGGLADLAALLEKERPTLIVIDTISRLLSARRDQSNPSEMTDILGPLQKLALMNDCAILVIDHHRKPGMNSVSDVVDDLSGATAKAAVADAIWGIYRKRTETVAKLAITGRDFKENEFAIEWDGLTFQWRMGGLIEEKLTSRRVGLVLAYLRDADFLTATVAASVLDCDRRTAQKALDEMYQAEQLRRNFVRGAGSRGGQYEYRRLLTDDEN